MAAKKFIRTGTSEELFIEVPGVVISSGVENAGDIPALNDSGIFDESLIPITTTIQNIFNSIELELAISLNNPGYYKEYSFSGDDITGYTIYDNTSKDNTILVVTLIFSGNDLTSKTIFRPVDNKTLTITYNYSDGIIISQTRNIT